MEWSLILFTTALQLACGLSLATIWLKYKTISNSYTRIAAMAVFPIAVCGMLVAMFHLGKPANGVYALMNIGTSWLSRENLLSSAFAGAACLYSFTWWKHKESYQTLLGVLTSLLGVCAVAASAMVYQIPTQIIWNSGWVLLSFFATTLLFSSFAVFFLSASTGKQPVAKSSLFIMGICGIALLISVLWMMSILGQATGDPYLTAKLQYVYKIVTGEYLPWLLVYMLFACLLPIGLMLTYWSGEKANNVNFRFGLVSFVFILLGSLAGRSLLYIVGPDNFLPF
ncbi:dimethyl sulfoxide reductase anchor subunit family protein [Sporomusa acidovorans]|uniref:DMSO reductase anchor subunit DmsC n=1 Tax=Sporomusa acidovorans (strain ATCC 49682 / DSM 3132 / Mol) TaxID=1123286 RepID=A0ABZ3J6G1_SPOA4|nr:DmsC/YnfH family molybdoenzyme membrane anchor subunit [Sporomusa acidovorans]OZC24284.1 DMSO reductase anchor subunit DmsC [Sporomusa acidovorans DSM 3132]SDF03016.1 anaerobic dimethyl sulfoxide reductase subunit C (DMSO reductase anchor subunit) [Sporomusa acidovorans]